MKETGVTYAATASAEVLNPEPGMLRQVLVYSPHMMLVRHRLSKGWVGTRHSHPHEQIVFIVSGQIEFVGGDKSFILLAGDSVLVDGNVEHRARALEDSEVLDVFAPYRSDYALQRPEALSLHTFRQFPSQHFDSTQIDLSCSQHRDRVNMKELVRARLP
jgi:quercetin dioxygenase-like cupin family protein